MLIPYTTGQVRLFHQSYVQDISVQVADSDQMAAVQQQITDLLRTRHRLTGAAVNDFNVRNNNQIIDTVQGTSQTLTYLLAGVAAVSLLVGGIGIMNIMLVSVTERVREIGIRMAIGAQPGSVLSLMMRHSALLVVIGAAVGLALTVSLTGLLRSTFPSNERIDLGVYALVVPALLAVTLLAALVPALRAARIDPLKALRQE